VIGAWRDQLPLTGLALALAFLAGCGGGSSGDTAHLQGTVTINSQPLPADAEGSIIFKPAEAGTARGVTATIVDGNYDAPEAPKGSVIVSFSIYKTKRATTINERTGQPDTIMESLVPEKYVTGVPIEVTGDKSDQDFNLTNE
jgi:hypothetical protein